MPHLDGSLCLHEPAAQHGLDLAVGELAVGRLDLPLHRVLQQQTPQAPVEEVPRSPPIQNVLRGKSDIDYTLLFSKHNY